MAFTEPPSSSNQPTLADSFISFGIFLLIQMGFAFLVKLCISKILVWFGLQAIPYGVALAIWFTWLLFVIMPLYFGIAFAMSELKYILDKTRIELEEFIKTKLTL